MVGQGAGGGKKRNTRINKRLSAERQGEWRAWQEKGDPSTRLGRRVEGCEAFVW